MKSVGIITWHDVTKSYSCLTYLRDELGENGDVELWSASNYGDDHTKEKGYYSFLDQWFGHIRKIRVYISKFYFFKIVKKYDIIIINDLDFFWSAYQLKKRYPQKIIIHYNTEIHGQDVKIPAHTVKFYEKNAGFPDMIIECLPERASYRSEKFLNGREVEVINNTLPYHIASEYLETTTDTDSYFSFKQNGIPTLIYAGGADLSRSLGDIIDCAEAFEGRVNFLFFCYGKPNEINTIRQLCRKHSNCYLYDAVDRRTLLKIMERCDIGVQYYDPDTSINHYLASPSKFYEYISVGLNIISSNNHGLDRMIEDNDLGVCFTKEEGIRVGIEKLLRKGLNSRENIQKVFREKLCYEVDAQRTVNKIKRLMES